MSRDTVNLDWILHPQQKIVFEDPARFKVVVAGRRWGKSRLAAMLMLYYGMQDYLPDGRSLKPWPIYYVAPTMEQARRIMWDMIQQIGGPLIDKSWETTHALLLPNGRRIELKGSDNPDSLLGVGLHFVVLDEFSSMRPETWYRILRPTLSDIKGKALFIGTPLGMNHFYDLYHASKELDDWSQWQFKSIDNPYLPKDEVREAKMTMTTELYKQEYEADFESMKGNELNMKWFENSIIDHEPPETAQGHWYVSVDLGGFSTSKSVENKYDLKWKDSTGIAIVNAHHDGWFVKEVFKGKWSVRETALRILLAARSVHSKQIGIEKGMLLNAIGPFLTEQMIRIGYHAHVEPLSHQNRRKNDRILYALGGRFENKRIKLLKGPWLEEFRKEYDAFPDSRAHARDDMLDALAYANQMTPRYVHSDVSDSFVDNFDLDFVDPAIGW